MPCFVGFGRVWARRCFSAAAGLALIRLLLAFHGYGGRVGGSACSSNALP